MGTAVSQPTSPRSTRTKRRPTRIVRPGSQPIRNASPSPPEAPPSRWWGKRVSPLLPPEALTARARLALPRNLRSQVPVDREARFRLLRGFGPSLLPVPGSCLVRGTDAFLVADFGQQLRLLARERPLFQQVRPTTPGAPQRFLQAPLTNGLVVAAREHRGNGHVIEDWRA